MPLRLFCFVFWSSLTLLSAVPGAARADVLRLSNGGELRGEVSRPGDDRGPEIEVRTLTGGRVTVERQQVKTLTRRRVVFETYETRAKNTPETVEAQWELAEWCRDNHLAAQRQTHLLNVVRLDPEHQKAHRLLGHMRRDDQWVSKDDAMFQQGYVKYNGEFVTPQERDLLKQQDAQRDVEKEWHKKVRLWYLWANGRNPQRRDEGMNQLHGVKDPDAIPALASFLQNNRDASWRSAFVEILGRIPGERPVGVLTLLSLRDDDTSIRSAAFEAIGPDRYSLAVPTYVAELRNGYNVIVCRAGSALGRIGDEHVVPQLIDALVTTHTYKVRVPTNEGTYSFSRGGTMTMRDLNGTAGEVLLPAEIEAALRTGQLSNGVIVVQPNKPVRTKLVTVRRDHQNSEVLAALTKLTEESFEFDENAWRVWWAAQKVQPAG